MFTPLENHADLYLKAELAVDAIKAKVKELKEQQALAQAEMDTAEKAIRDSLTESEYVTDTFTIKYSASRALYIADVNAIPKEFQITAVTPDKRAILIAMKEGPVAGVSISDDKLLTISKNA